MKFVSTCAATIALLLSTPATAGAYLTDQSPHGQNYIPPLPPAPNYDPIPGPFIIHLSDTGQLDEDHSGVIANAIASWSTKKPGVFLICFRSQTDRPDWRAAFKALDTVSRELKVQGAEIVVRPSGGRCDTAPTGSMSGMQVEITGVVRT